MRHTLFLLLFLPFLLCAQKVDVLLIGASHSYASAKPQDFSGMYSQIKNFKPTVSFGEFLSREDERLMMDY